MAKNLKIPSQMVRINLSINADSNEKDLIAKMSEFIKSKEEISFNEVMSQSVFSSPDFDNLSYLFKQLFEDVKLGEMVAS